MRTYERGEQVFAPAPAPGNVFLLEQGLVRVYRVSPTGEQLTIGFVHPGQVFGELSALSHSPRESFAQATRRSVAWRMPGDAFMKTVQSDPSAVLEVTMQIAGRLKKIESRIEDLVFRSARARLARVLLALAEEFGENESEWVSIDLPITQAELATLTGSTRQTVNDGMRALIDTGMVARERGRLLLLCPPELEKLAARVDY